MKVEKFLFHPHGDENGQLVAIEKLKDIPFKIKRIYYMYDTGIGVHRGKHAHKSLKQILICVHGRCRIKLDDGEDQAEIAEEISDTELSIPLYYGMKDSEIDYVVDTLNCFE